MAPGTGPPAESAAPRSAPSDPDAISLVGCLDRPCGGRGQADGERSRGRGGSGTGATSRSKGGDGAPDATLAPSDPSSPAAGLAFATRPLGKSPHGLCPLGGGRERASSGAAGKARVPHSLALGLWGHLQDPRRHLGPHWAPPPTPPRPFSVTGGGGGTPAWPGPLTGPCSAFHGDEGPLGWEGQVGTEGGRPRLSLLPARVTRGLRRQRRQSWPRGAGAAVEASSVCSQGPHPRAPTTRWVGPCQPLGTSARLSLNAASPARPPDSDLLLPSREDPATPLRVRPDRVTAISRPFTSSLP